MQRKTDVVIIGAGQAGLAMSRCLSDLGIDHVVLDRGRIGQRWKAERWHSLRLLTPNWMTRLPGHRQDDADPDGFMHKDAFAGLLDRYAQRIEAPVHEFASVRSVTRFGRGFRVATEAGDWQARCVVAATGACDRPAVPGMAGGLSDRIHQVTADRYRHPGQLPDGGVLVVGASATGVQLAEEIHASGRNVTLAVGAHVRLPRRYRGRDIMGWLDACGLLAENRDASVSADRALRQISLQLVGGTPPRDIDLALLAARGIRCTGRANAICGAKIRFDDSLPREIAAAEARRSRTLAAIDDYIERAGLAAPEDAAPRAPLRLREAAPREIDLAAEGIRSVLWATGYRRAYPWLHLPVLTADGEIRQQGGVTPLPGFYALGLPFMRRRNSTFIDGVGADARDLATHIAADLGAAVAQAA